MKNLPKEVTEVYDYLWNEVRLITFKWHTYKELFYSNDERLRLFEKTANGFFHICQESIMADVLISLSRITDEPKSDKGARITLKRLLLLNQIQLDKEYLLELEENIKEAELSCISIRTIRNNFYSHLNFNAILSPELHPLPDVPIDQINNAVKSVQKVISTFATHVYDEDHRFDHALMVGGVDTLVYHLKNSIKVDSEERQRFKN